MSSMGKVKRDQISEQQCSNTDCETLVHRKRISLGYDTCMTCGEAEANQRRYTVVPMHKSNYVPVTNLIDLRGINNKGGFFR